VRGPKHVFKRGKTPVLDEDQARRLLAGLDTSTLVGLRDRALIGVMTYAFARIGAVVALRRGLLPGRQALVAAAARERRQAPRDAGASQARALPR
jgi:site-specific recombinase XerC